MGATLTEKLIARSMGVEAVRAGEIVSVPTHRVLFNDYVGALLFSKLEQLGVTALPHPERAFLAVDHQMPAFTVEAADRLVMFREKAAKYGITHITKPGWHGIGHQMMVEELVRPLEVAVGTDSHATLYGGLGAFSCGITTSDAVQALTLGSIWLKVPETIQIRVTGKLPPWVTAKDLALHILGLFPEKDYTYKAVEIVGEGISALSMDARFTLANMIADTGAKCAVFEADEKAWRYAGLPVGERLQSDPDASFFATATVDASKLEPLLSCPDSVRNVHPLREYMGIHVDQVFIGSCTNGRMEDLLQAAEILKGRRVAENTRLIVTPASQRIALEAVENGVMEILLKAGATVLPASCASCAGHGPGLIGRGEVCVSTTNRNFKGRMGSPDAKIFLGSAYAAAAAAVTGEICDPRTTQSIREMTA